MVMDLTRGIYRRVYAGAVKGERINGISERAELLFWRLHMIADDWGNFHADPVLIKGAAYPKRRISPSQIVVMLEELRGSGIPEKGKPPLVHFYEVDGERYGHITDFETLQPAGKNGTRIRRIAAPSESDAIRVNPSVLQKPGPSEDHNQDHNQDHSEKTPLPPSLDTPDFRDSWELWIQHRRENRKPLRPTGAKRMLAKLAKMGPERAVAAIDHSIANGWQGVFEPKDNGHPKAEGMPAMVLDRTPTLAEVNAVLPPEGGEP